MNKDTRKSRKGTLFEHFENKNGLLSGLNGAALSDPAARPILGEASRKSGRQTKYGRLHLYMKFLTHLPLSRHYDMRGR
jgi:hypothetical protein